MSLTLYAHPFSSYCQKVLIPLYEIGVAFEYKQLGADPEPLASMMQLWPVAKFPVLVDGAQSFVESTIIIEHLDLHHAGGRYFPADRDAALQVRLLDRVFDNYVMTPMQRIVADFIRAPQERHPQTVSEAKALLDKTYAWLDANLAGREWAAGADFTLADCAAAPSLFYADWVHQIPASYKALRAYRARLLTRPSFARAVDEARPFRQYFPPGAPDRD